MNEFETPAIDGLAFHVLGGADVARQTDGKRLFRAGKPLALLCYLAHAPGRTAPVEYLIELLWSDLAPDSADHAFRQAIWLVRQRIGAESLTRERHGFQLRIPFTSDRNQFLDAVERGDLEQAVDAYTGDFLGSVALPGAASFEHWAETERQRLRLVFERTAETLVRRWLSAGRFRDARKLSQRLRDMDRLNEVAWRLLIESYLSAGDRVTATVEVTSLERLFEHENREPEPATSALLRRVRTGSDASASDEARNQLVAELVGREAEFATIIDAWSRVGQGHGAHIHLSGAPGLGKSRLLNDVRTRLRATGARVASVRGNVGSREVPYSFAGDLAGAVGGLSGIKGISPTSAVTLVGLHPPLAEQFNVRDARQPIEELTRLRTIAVAEAMRAVSAERPLALLIDDVQWIDAESLRILAAVVHQVVDDPILVVTTARASAEKMVQPANSTQLDLLPLSADEITDLVVSLGELPTESWATELPARLYETSKGSPLVALETLRLLIGHGTLAREHGVWRCADSEALTEALQPGTTLDARVSELPAPERQALLMLAVLGGPMGASLLKGIDETAEPSMSTMLMQLERRGLAVRSGESWRVVHDEVAEAALGSATPQEQQRLHHSVGNCLARSDRLPDLTRAARHLRMAGQPRELRALFRLRMRIRNRIGERRSATDIAREFLGDQAKSDDIARLVSSVSFFSRLNLSRREIVAALVIAILATTLLGFASIRSNPIPDAVLVAAPLDDNDGSEGIGVEIFRDPWSPDEPLEHNRADLVRWLGDLSGYSLRHSEANPDGQSLAYSRMARDSGGIEIFIRTADGDQRVTYSPGDDFYPTWAPDGRELAFATARYSAESWNEIVVLNMGSGQLRRLTDDVAGEIQLRWSPDGSRIAFQRVRTEEGLPALVCWITIDGLDEDCLDDEAILRNARGFYMAGWLDGHRLLGIAGGSDGTLQIVTIDVTTWMIDWTGIAAGFAAVSRNGKWVLCNCQPPGRVGGLYVYRSNNPEEGRLIAGVDGLASYEGQWIASDPNHFITRLEVAAIGEIAQHDQPILRVGGYDESGLPANVPYVRWQVLDTTLATIDKMGRLSPRSPGSVRVVASAGGFRADTMLVVMKENTERPVLSEHWQRMESQWEPYGIPRPKIVKSADGAPVFHNNGDGSLFSGAYLRRTLNPKNGIGVSAMVSTPINKVHWQVLHVLLTSVPGDPSYPGWDRDYEHFPYWIISRCHVILPAGEGRDLMHTVLFGSIQRTRFLDNDITDGSWWEITVQLFPDGRCGYAINGQALMVTESPAALPEPMRVVLQGNSSDTKILVGPLEIWEGVREGIDWSAARRERGTVP